jgi:hypothetical protein
MKDNQPMDNEVRLRVLKKTTDSRFESMRNEFALMLKNSDDKFEAMEKNTKIEFELSRKNSDDKFNLLMENFNDKLDNRFKSLWSIGILIMGLLTPVFLKSIGVL